LLWYYFQQAEFFKEGARMERLGLPASCICCGVPTVAYFTKKNKHGEYPLVKCPECRCSFVWPRPDSEAIVLYYSSLEYSNQTYEQVIEAERRYYPNAARDSKRIIKKCTDLSIGELFLDVGAGVGIYARTAADQGFKVFACEPNPNARQVFAKFNTFEAEPCMLDHNFSEHNKGRFDVVLLSQVLEHVVEPEDVVRYIFTILNRGGIAAIAVPFFGSALSKIQGKNDMFVSPPEHLNYFSKRGLTALFERHNFKLEFLETVSKVNRGRIEDAIAIPVVSKAVWLGLYGILKLFEVCGMGMVINAYFRKDG
jgi:SAM-dependent methyltransferase